MKITKSFNFNCAHILDVHNDYCDDGGLCSYLHGQTYKLEVTVEETQIQTSSTSYVIDEIIKNNILNVLDHTILIDIKNRTLMEFAMSQQWKLLVLPFSTTAENIAKWIWAELNQLNGINKNYDFVKVKLWETPTSYYEVNQK
jgi:6-pyruvoyltetrahydropterin/6-carboxytetrahydropterin synthase